MDPMGMLGVLAAVGIASSVSMASAQARLIRTAERVRTSAPKHRDVFDAQFASMAALGVTGAVVLALACSHVVMIGSFAAAATGPDPLPFLVTGVLATLLVVLLLAESARLVIPGRSPVPVQRRGNAAVLEERLVELTVRAARRSGWPILPVLMVIALLLVLAALWGWAGLTGVLGYLILLLGGSVLANGLRGVASSAVMERGVSRWITLSTSVAMGALGWLAAVSSIGSMLLNEPLPRTWVALLVVLLLGMVLLGAGMVLTVLGSAGIGPFRREGLQHVAQAALAGPSSLRRPAGMLAVQVGAVGTVELLVCLALTIVVVGPDGGRDIAMSGVLAACLAIGGAAPLLQFAAVLDRERQLARWPPELRRAVGVDRRAVLVQLVAAPIVLCAPVLTIALGVLGRSFINDAARTAAAALLCLWVLAHLAVVVIACFWPAGSVAMALRCFGTRITAVRAGGSRRWLGRVLSADDPWSDLHVRIWLRRAGDQARDRLRAS